MSPTLQLYTAYPIVLFQSILAAGRASIEVRYIVVTTDWLINSIGALTHCSTGGVTWTNHSYRAETKRTV